MAHGSEADRSGGTAIVPLLLIHGYPFDSTMWSPVQESLGERVTTIAPNLRGFGGTELGDAEPSLEVMADDIAQILDRSSIPRVVIAGISMGGYVALAFAERHADRVAGLGLVSTQAAADSTEARDSRRKMIENVRAKGSKAAVEAILPKMFAPAHISDSNLTSHLFEGARKAGVDGICWALEAMARRPDRHHVIEDCSCPVTVIHGDEDAIIPIEKARAMVEKAEEADFVEISRAGHCTPLEAPAEVAAALGNLLRRAVQSDSF